jgi:hypothetical protein
MQNEAENIQTIELIIINTPTSKPGIIERCTNALFCRGNPANVAEPQQDQPV